MALAQPTWIQDDHALIWHPFTQHFNAPSPIPIVSAKGVWLFGPDPKYPALLDLISSWWVNLFGHTNPNIAEAIADQAKTLDHVLFAGFSHEKASLLARHLITMTHNSFHKVFFSDNGSTAVEVALKLAFQFFQNQGIKSRTRFLALEGGYHGDTFGAMAVGKNSGFFPWFDDLLKPVTFIPCPYEGWGIDEELNDEQSIKATKALEFLDTYLDQYGHETAAFIMEPLVQGASGMNMISPSFLNKVIERLKRYDIFIIADEVMTGFGRTGKMFAYQHLDYPPDFLCLSKGITGGFLPLGVTLVTQDIFNHFLAQGFTKAFAHGHSYTANPISCAAACATMELLQHPATVKRWKTLENTHRQGLNLVASMTDRAHHFRLCGTISAMNIKGLDGYGEPKTIRFHQQLLSQGLLLRPLGSVVYFMPPYIMEESDLLGAYATLGQVINSL